MRILFQGDSITDCSRDYDDIQDLGSGYPKFVAENLKEIYPDIEFEFINKGIGGHKTRDLLNRWENDAIALQPDIISILVGINDTWHCVPPSKEVVTNESYENNYRELLKQIKEKTNAKIIVLEQFLLPVPDKNNFHNDMDEKLHLTRKVAREYADVFIPLDGLFASACISEEPTYWAEDGVHPSTEGHKLIAEYYLDAACDLIDQIIENEA